MPVPMTQRTKCISETAPGGLGSCGTRRCPSHKHMDVAASAAAVDTCSKTAGSHQPQPRSAVANSCRLPQRRMRVQTSTVLQPHDLHTPHTSKRPPEHTATTPFPYEFKTGFEFIREGCGPPRGPAPFPYEFKTGFEFISPPPPKNRI